MSSTHVYNTSQQTADISVSEIGIWFIVLIHWQI